MKTPTNRIIPLGLLAAVTACFVVGVTQAQIPVLSTKDKVASRVGVFRGGSIFTPDGLGHTGQAGDRAVDFGMGTGPVYVQDATFLNALAQNDEMSVALWVYKYDTADGSGFWMNSPSSSEGTRGFQAHIPWSNNNVYFDTAGCCAAPQRINANVDNWTGWSGDWLTWHFLVFVKKGADKQIWIDGQLFLDQETANPGIAAAKLPTDFTDMYIGSDGTGAGLFHALVDDFSIYGTALSEATIAQLYSGTLPTALPASDKLTAYWDFNDVPGEGIFLSVSPAPNATGAAPNLIRIVHVDGVVPWAAGNVTLKVDGATVTPDFNKDAITATLTYVPTPPFTGHTTHTVSLTYPGDAGTPVTAEWSFLVGPYTKDVVASRIGTFLDGSTFTADAGGRTGQPGDLGADFGNLTGPVRVHDATFLNALAQNDVMCFAFWLKKPAIEAGSAFWANSPSSAADQRGFQAHVPWSTSEIYFDTSGCCGAATERIYANINTFAYYSGEVSWWNDWHHFVFQKNLSTKEIWIDGQYFLIGANTDPLPTDFTELFIGASAPGVNRMSGVIDDFAIFGTALSEATIGQLAGGTAPTALPAADKLTAYWSFDDFPAAGMFTSIVPAPNSQTARPDLIYVRHMDGTVVWDQSKVSLKVDDAPVSFTFAKTGRLSDVSFVPDPYFEVGSTHKATLTYPGEGTAQETLEWQFTVGTFEAVGTDLWTAPGTGDSTKPGLKARVWQIDQLGTVGLLNYVRRAEQELAGIIGPNVADMTTAVDGAFNVDLVNWNQDHATAEIGSFQTGSTPSRPDKPIPGIPGTGNTTYNTDNIAAEVIAYLEFPAAGFYQMGVNSDDGFRVNVGDTPPANNLSLVVSGAPSAAGSYHTAVAPAATAKPFTAPISAKLVYMDPADGCTEPVNAAALSGNIALVDRGTCEFTAKIRAAKDAGAIAVVVVNNRSDDLTTWPEGVFPIEMGAGVAGYQDIPAVMISMPDGDKIKTGLGSELIASLTPDDTPALGVADVGRGSADTIFAFTVPKAGVYPFRCVWFEGGGGANLEWFTVTPSGEKILINDTSNPAALKAYRARTASPQPTVTLSVARSGNNLTITSDPQPLPAGFELQTAPSINGPWTTQAGANTPITVPIGTEQAVFLRAAKP
ncbi:MAG TPA: hypothetical protein P5534_02860 [Candidatus Paceibacterota bacterium]|nr:hypothetical protein [Candidatus Paceibacterota bacterium]